MTRALVVALVAVAACKGEKLKWKPQVLTQETAGPFTFDIPPGWRDLSESAMPELASMSHKLGADGHLIVRANDTNTDTNIAFLWAVGPVGFTCDKLLDGMEAGGLKIDRSTLVAQTFGSDDGCTFQLKEDDEAATVFVRMHGDHFFTLQCMHNKSGTDADLDVTCTRLAAALKAQ